MDDDPEVNQVVINQVGDMYINPSILKNRGSTASFQWNPLERLAEYYSFWHRLLRAVACLRRIRDRLRKLTTSTTQGLTTRDINTAEQASTKKV